LLFDDRVTLSLFLHEISGEEGYLYADVKPCRNSESLRLAMVLGELYLLGAEYAEAVLIFHENLVPMTWADERFDALDDAPSLADGEPD
jgi:hypothetical protein